MSGRHALYQDLTRFGIGAVPVAVARDHHGVSLPAFYVLGQQREKLGHGEIVRAVVVEAHHRRTRRQPVLLPEKLHLRRHGRRRLKGREQRLVLCFKVGDVQVEHEGVALVQLVDAHCRVARCCFRLKHASQLEGRVGVVAAQVRHLVIEGDARRLAARVVPRVHVDPSKKRVAAGCRGCAGEERRRVERLRAVLGPVNVQRGRTQGARDQRERSDAAEPRSQVSRHFDDDAGRRCVWWHLVQMTIVL